VSDRPQVAVAEHVLGRLGEQQRTLVAGQVTGKHLGHGAGQRHHADAGGALGPSPIAITLTAANYQRHRQEGRPGFAAQMEEQGHTSRQDILEVGPVPAASEVALRLGIDEGANVVMRRLRFVVDELPVQLVRVYYRPELAAGSQLEQPVPIPDGVHGELRRLGVQVTRFVEDFMGARLPDPDEERALQLPSGVPVTRNIRTAYAGDRPVEVMDTISHGEVVSFRFEVKV
jgi:GntR family transcriptional regulator